MNVEDLRLAVYRTFAGTGRAPDTGQLAGQLQASLPEVTWGLKELASARHLVLGDQGQIGMAHPFSPVPLGFSVMGTGTHRPPDGGQVAHFLVPAPRMWDDVVHTCRHQRIFCSEDCVSAWLDAIGSARGYLLNLGTLWRLAAHWYDGRLDRGYTRPYSHNRRKDVALLYER